LQLSRHREIILRTQVFCAAAPENVQCLISHKDQSQLTVDEVYQVFFAEHRVKKEKRISTVHTISNETESHTTEPEITAFQPQQKQQPWSNQQGSGARANHNRGQNNYQGNNSCNKPASGQGSNASWNSKFCIYCKIMNHTQQECQKRIRDNKLVSTTRCSCRNPGA